MSETHSQLLDPLGLTEYEESALTELLTLGQSTAPDLSEATGIPKARIYGVLDSLADEGFVKIVPGRPKQYQAKPPAELLDRAVENRRQEYESYHQRIESVREQFLDEFEPLYEKAQETVTPAEELFYVVDVGEESERETRALYHDADDAVYVLTKSFEYLSAVEPALRDALAEGVSVRVLLLHPRHLSPDNREIQADVVGRLREEFPGVEFRYSNDRLPWRGTLIDPSADYEGGKAIFLVEEEDVPNHLRQAAITENGSFVAGLKRYFDLVWTHDSVADGEGERFSS